MMLWSCEGALGSVWAPVVRVGDVGGALGGSIGNNLLGFVGGCPSPDGLSVLGVGYGGSFHWWTTQGVSGYQYIAIYFNRYHH